ncbi:MAG TPA: type II toxin-antitoxin system HicA family toxin [Thermoplasmata archaeon]|nr:type II toxin-antitoxin system HicA family toxin [Thermoplasmata archaeon]
MSKLPGEISRRAFLRAMARLGWSLLRVRGSHHQFVHDRFPGVLTVAMHDTISRVAVRKTLKAAGIEEDGFLDAL